MNKLTPAQAKMMKVLDNMYNNLPKKWQDSPMAVAERWKNGWCKNWGQSGLNTNVLKALDKKGLIKLHVTFDRQTGVHNKRADSWGYSSVSEEYFVELIGKK
jgi:hypothetical protein